MTCTRPSWRSSWGCGRAWPSYEPPSRGGPRSGACRRRRTPMRAKRVRSGSCYIACLSSACGLQPEGPTRGFDVRVKVVLLVVHPSCPHCHSHIQPPVLSVFSSWAEHGNRTRKLVRHVLIVLVAKFVGADQRAGLGVTCGLVSVASLGRPQWRRPSVRMFLPIYCSRAAARQSSSRSCERIERCRTYLELVPVFLQNSGLAEALSRNGGVSHLQANLAKVAERSRDGRHLDGGSIGVRASGVGRAGGEPW